MQYQLFDDLGAKEYQSLKDSIRENGILVPIEYDEAGNILDGHHRLKAWEELKAEGVILPDFTSITRRFADEQQKLNHVRTLNLIRRHLTKEQMKPHWEEMRKTMTLDAIAQASGVTAPTVRSALEESTFKDLKVEGKDGKKRPATYKPRKPKPTPQLSIFASTEKQRESAQQAAQSEVVTSKGKSAITTTEASKQISNSHISDDSHEWYTPEEYISAARGVMGSIDLDPATSQQAQEVIKAENYYTKEDDGLTKEWAGNMWLNPPYDIPEQFIDKTIEGYITGAITSAIILTNNSTDTKWFHKLIEYPFCLTLGRIKFWNGEEILPARQGQAIFYLGNNPELFAKIFNSFGVVVHRYDYQQS